MVTALFFVLSYEEKTLLEEPDNPEDRTIFQIIEYFSNRDLSIPKGETFSISVTLSIPKLIDDSSKEHTPLSIQAVINYIKSSQSKNLSMIIMMRKQ